MFALAFLNPLLLWAVPLAAVPIVIHLLNRRRFKRVPWAAMEYLLAAMKRNRKRLRMEQWLVLLLRTLAVLFLALLVARPQLEGGGLIGTRTHHVVLIDDSASMQQRSGSVSCWDKAQDQVRQLADRLAETRGGDIVSLVRTGRPTVPELWGQRIGPDLGRHLGQLLKELPPGDGTMDLGALLAETHKRAQATEEASRTEYYLVGDRRAVDWVTDDDKPRPAVLSALAAMDPASERVTAMAVGSRDADNLAIVRVRRVDRFAVAGVPVELAVDVRNMGLDASQATEVAVEMDGGSRVVRPVPQLAPGESVPITVVHTFHAAGPHRVEAALPATDHYLVDDRRTLALPVQDKSRVLLVDGEPDEEDGGETLFLQVALDPGGEHPSGIEAQVVTESELAAVELDTLDTFDMVWLCNVPAPSAEVVGRLEAFVRGGGGLVVFVGNQVDTDRYNEVLWRGGEGLLPLPLGEIAGDPQRPEHMVLTDKDHPICGGMGDVLEVLCNVAVLVKRHLTVVDDPRAGAAVLARIGDAEGSPAIVSRTFGSGGGETVLFAISADKHWSNWPDTDANLVMAHQVHRFAARARDLSGTNLETDGTFTLDLDAGLHKADVVVRALTGDGEEHTFTATRAQVPTPGEGAGGEAGAEPGEQGGGTPAGPEQPIQLVVPMQELRTLGAYEVEVQLHAGILEPRVLARNAPIAESRLVQLAQRDFARIFPAEVHDLVAFRDETSGFGSGSGEGEIWRGLATAMLLALLLESLLAWRFGRR